MSVRVGIRRLPHAGDMALPSYQTAFAAGADLMAAIEGEIVLAPGERRLVPSGIAIELPPGYEAQVRPRSGLALKQGITVLNTPGTIDADYRGEIGVILINLGGRDVTIGRGDRIAQMIIAPVVQAEFVEGELSETARGSGGFGSTGKG